MAKFEKDWKISMVKGIFLNTPINPQSLRVAAQKKAGLQWVKRQFTVEYIFYLEIVVTA